MASTDGERHFLYVAEPGIRNYVEYGGIGVLVYDIDRGHKFVKRIPTFPDVAAARRRKTSRASPPAPKPGRLYVATIKRVMAFDLETEQMLWDRTVRRRRRPAGHLA